MKKEIVTCDNCGAEGDYPKVQPVRLFGFGESKTFDLCRDCYVALGGNAPSKPVRGRVPAAT